MGVYYLILTLCHGGPIAVTSVGPFLGKQDCETAITEYKKAENTSDVTSAICVEK